MNKKQIYSFYALLLSATLVNAMEQTLYGKEKPKKKGLAASVPARLQGIRKPTLVVKPGLKLYEKGLLTKAEIQSDIEDLKRPVHTKTRTMSEQQKARRKEFYARIHQTQREKDDQDRSMEEFYGVGSPLLFSKLACEGSLTRIAEEFSNQSSLDEKSEIDFSSSTNSQMAEINYGEDTGASAFPDYYYGESEDGETPEMQSAILYGDLDVEAIGMTLKVIEPKISTTEGIKGQMEVVAPLNPVQDDLDTFYGALNNNKHLAGKELLSTLITTVALKNPTQFHAIMKAKGDTVGMAFAECYQALRSLR